MNKERKGQKVIYYDDLLNDEFSTAQIEPRRIDENYVYIHKGLFKKLTHFFWYRIVATPLAWLYLKIKFRHKIINRGVLKGVKDGYFLFGNHTQAIADALIPSMISYPKHTYVIVHPNNVSMPVLGRITPSLGALPLPDDKTAAENFIRAVKTRVEEGKAVCIYPEAHIWPYYTKIRPFGEKSFRYPVNYGKPTYCFTNTYQKRGKRGQKVRLVTYVDGPFYPDGTKSAQEGRKELRDKVYAAMCERAKNSDIQIIKYEKRKEV